MIVSEKLLQNHLDYNQFLLKKIFEVKKKPNFSGEKIINSGHCIYDYVHSFFGGYFQSNGLYW